MLVPQQLHSTRIGIQAQAMVRVTGNSCQEVKAVVVTMVLQINC